MSLYSGSAGTPAFQNRTVVSDHSKLEETWKKEQERASNANKSFEWVSGLQLDNQKVANEWADRMGERDVKALNNLLTSIEQKIIPIVTKEHLKNYAKKIESGSQKHQEVGAPEFKKLTKLGAITSGESELKGITGLSSVEVEKAYGAEFAEWWRTAHRTERKGFKIALMKSKAENFPVWEVNQIAELQEAAKRDPENQRTWANPTDPKEKWTIADRLTNSDADRAISMSLRQEYVNQVSLSVPGKPLSADLVAHHLGGPALALANKGLKDRGLARNKQKGADALAQSNKDLINAFDDWDEENPGELSNELKYIVSNIAPELRMAAGTQAPQNGTWNTTAVDTLKNWIDEDIKTAEDPLDRARKWALVLKDQKFLHPAGKAQLATDNQGNPIPVGKTKGGKTVYRKEKLGDAGLALGEWATEEALLKAGKDYKTSKNYANYTNDRKDAKVALGDLQGQAEEDRKNGTVINQDYWDKKEMELRQTHPYSYDLIQDYFSKQNLAKVSRDGQMQVLKNLNEKRFLEVTREDLKKLGVDEDLFDVFNAANPEIQIVESYIGSDNTTQVNRIEDSIITDIGTIRNQTSIDGSTSAWSDDTHDVHYLYRKEVYNRAIQAKRLDKGGTRSDLDYIGKANKEVLGEMKLANDAKAPDESHWSYLTPNRGFLNATKERFNTSPYSEAQILIDNANKLKGTGWEIRSKNRFFKDLKYLERRDRDGDGQLDYHPTLKVVAAKAGQTADDFWEKENRLSEQPGEPPEREEPVQSVVTTCYDLIDTGLGIGGIHSWTDLNALGNTPSRKCVNTVVNEIRSNNNQVDPHQIGTLMIQGFPKQKRKDVESLVTKAITLSPTDKNRQLYTFAALFYGVDPKDMLTNPTVMALGRELVDEIRTPQSGI